MHKTQVQVDQRPHINPVSLNLIEEKVESSLECMGTGGHFLNMTQVPQTLRATISKWNLLKLKSFCKAKDMVNKTNDSLQNKEKIFTVLWLTILCRRSVEDLGLLRPVPDWLLQSCLLPWAPNVVWTQETAERQREDQHGCHTFTAASPTGQQTKAKPQIWRCLSSQRPHEGLFRDLNKTGTHRLKNLYTFSPRSGT